MTGAIRPRSRRPTKPARAPKRIYVIVTGPAPARQPMAYTRKGDAERLAPDWGGRVETYELVAKPRRGSAR